MIEYESMVAVALVINFSILIPTLILSILAQRDEKNWKYITIVCLLFMVILVIPIFKYLTANNAFDTLRKVFILITTMGFFAIAYKTNKKFKVIKGE